MNNPLISVIIPAYNAGRFVLNAVESVTRQTFKDYEIIVVDDGSFDGTDNLLKQFLNILNYIKKDNAGPASARNAGIKAAKGKYIAFLDADDEWLPHKLSAQVDFLESNDNYSMVFSNALSFGEEERGLFLPANTVFNEKDFLNIMLIGNKIPVLTVMIKKEVFRNIGYFDESKEFISVEDYDLWLRVINKYKIKYLNDVVAKYRVGKSGISSDLAHLKEKENLVVEKFLKKNPDIYENLKKRGELHNIMAYRCFDFGKALLRSGYKPQARLYIFKALNMGLKKRLKGFIYVFFSFVLPSKIIYKLLLYRETRNKK